MSFHKSFPDAVGGGSPALGSGTVLFWNFMALPLGALDGSEVPEFMAAGMSVSSISNLEKFAKGVSVETAATGSIIFADVPAKTLDRRRYVMSLSLDESGATNNIIDLRFNYLNGSNFWTYRIGDTAGDWTNYLYQDGGTLRDSDPLNTGIQNCTATVILEEYGDEIHAAMIAAEDGTGDVVQDVTILNYYVASRPNKTETGIRIFWQLPDIDKMRVQSILIQDFE